MEQRILIINQRESVVFAEVMKEIGYLINAGFKPNEVRRFIRTKWNIEDEEEFQNMINDTGDLLNQILDLLCDAGLGKKEAQSLMNAFMNELMKEVKLKDPREGLPQGSLLS